MELLNIIGQNTGLRFQPWWVSNAQQAQALVDQGRAMVQLTVPLTGDDAMRTNTLPVWRALWGVYVGQMSQPVTGWQQLKGRKVGSGAVILPDSSSLLMSSRSLLTRIKACMTPWLTARLMRWQTMLFLPAGWFSRATAIRCGWLLRPVMLPGRSPWGSALLIRC
uniref:hypothetical protein n=1 Tax=Erwinia sp. E_sp_W01_6 TaxID=3039408 RepID=UPI00403F09E4